jgi:hypothetical protein
LLSLNITPSWHYGQRYLKVTKKKVFQQPAKGIHTFETCEAVMVIGSPFPNIKSGWQDAHFVFAFPKKIMRASCEVDPLFLDTGLGDNT